jgi:hypothetical protein
MKPVARAQCEAYVTHAYDGGSTAGLQLPAFKLFEIPSTGCAPKPSQLPELDPDGEEECLHCNMVKVIALQRREFPFNRRLRAVHNAH